MSIVFGLVGIVLIIVVLSARRALLAVGFSTGGVLARSVATFVQSTIGKVAAGGVFATLQSVGAAGGLSWKVSCTMVVMAVGAIVVAFVFYYYRACH